MNQFLRLFTPASVLLFLLVSCQGSAERQYYPSDEIEPADRSALYFTENNECAIYPERCVDFSATQTADAFDRRVPADPLANDAISDGGGCTAGCDSAIPGCEIKGNISIETGEKIYHMPGDQFYSATKISPEYGERWFCTEAEAKANGWRRTQAR